MEKSAPPPPSAEADEEDDEDFGGKKKGKKEKKGSKVKGKGKDDDDGEDEPAAPAAPVASGGGARGLIVALVVDVRKHPDSKMTKASVCTVDAGDRGSVEVVCNATNLQPGITTVLAPLGGSVVTPKGLPMEIKPISIREVPSEGMLCGRGEIGLCKAGEPFPTEVVLLSDDLEPGTPFETAMLQGAAPAAHEKAAAAKAASKGGKPDKVDAKEPKGGGGGKKKKKGGKMEWEEEEDDVDAHGNIKGLIAYSDEEVDEQPPPKPASPEPPSAAAAGDNADSRLDAPLRAALNGFEASVGATLAENDVCTLADAQDLSADDLKELGFSVGIKNRLLKAFAAAGAGAPAAKEEEKEEETPKPALKAAGASKPSATAMAAALGMEEDDDEEETPSPPPKKDAAKPSAAAMAAALGMQDGDEDEDEGEDEEDDAPAGSTKVQIDALCEWLETTGVPSQYAQQYAEALGSAGYASADALRSAAPTVNALVALGLRRGHACLLSRQVGSGASAAATEAATEQLRELHAWLLSLAIGEADANVYAPKLLEAYSSLAVLLEDDASSASLGRLGLKRGHAGLLLVHMPNASTPEAAAEAAAAEQASLVVPTFDFGPTRLALRGPTSLRFRADIELPLFDFTATTAAVEATSETKTKSKKLDDDDGGGDGEFDFGAKKKKDKKAKEEKKQEEVDAEAEAVDFDFGAAKKKKKKPKEGEAAEEADDAADFAFGSKKDKKPKDKEEEAEADADFDFGSKKKSKSKDKDTKEKDTKDKEGKKGKEGKEGKEVKKTKSVEELAKEKAEMDALLAELDAPEVEMAPELVFSLGNVGKAEDGEMPETESGEGSAAAGVSGDASKAGGGEGTPSGGGKGKKGKKGKGKDKVEEEDDDDALLAAAMAERAAITGEDLSAKNDKKKKKKSKQGGGEEGGAAEDAPAKEGDAPADGDAAANETEAGGADEAGGDEDGDEGDEGEGGGKLTKAQKKKLKAKEKKKQEAEAGEDGKKKDDGKKRPNSKIAEKLREEQARRALEEKAAITAAELLDEATRLFKCIDVLNLGEKALKRLDSAEVSADVVELVARGAQALEDFPGFESITKIDAIIAQLQLRMDNFLKLEERRRIKREKEKAKKEEMRAAGLLLSAKEKEKLKRQEAFLASLGKTDEGADAQAEDGETVKKKVVYEKRKKKPTKNEGAEADGADGADEGVPEAGVDDGAAAAEETAEAAALAPSGAVEEMEEEWDEIDEQHLLAKANLDVGDEDDEEEEEEFVAAPGELSSTLAALAASNEAAKMQAEKRKEEVMDKLMNMKKKDKDESESDEDDEDEDDDEDDESEEDEVAAGKAAARETRTERMRSAIEARTPDRLRSSIVCIMGHVDTGKTKLLDNIRRTNVQEGEAGGITQQIGASFFPAETLRERMGSLVEKKNITVKVPGLMIIDTPGHESFSNLRSRGSSLCDLAIVVVDIMHGLEPQTIESLTMLRSKKTPFVIALNKVDRLYGWSTVKDRPFIESLEVQPEGTRSEFESRASQVLLQLAEQGLNAELYYKNKDFKEYVSLIPTSAITGEGVPDILMMLVLLSQKMLVDRVMWCPEVQCTVLEVKVIEGLGTTADVILANGTLKRGDQIVMCGFSGPVVTRVRELLTPRPLREMRVKTDYLHHDSIDGAMGIKICANNLEGVVAGSACLVPYKDVPYDLEVLKEDVMSDLSQLAKAASEVNGGVGVYAIASTLGSLEALLEFLKTSKIPVSAVNIGPIHKKDVMKASIMHQFKSEYATILAFDVNLTKEGADMAKELNVRIFTAEIIYHLFDQFTAYMADVRKAQQAAAALTAVFPCVCQISSPEHVWCRGGGGDPILVGMDVKEGTLRVGTPICVERKGQKDPTTGLQAYLDIGRVIGIEINRKQVNMVKVGQSAAVKIDAVTTVQFGRHFDHTYEMYSHVTRPSIDALKEFFREDLVNEDLQLLVRLKKQFGVL